MIHVTKQCAPPAQTQTLKHEAKQDHSPVSYGIYARRVLVEQLSLQQPWFKPLENC